MCWTYGCPLVEDIQQGTRVQSIDSILVEGGLLSIEAAAQLRDAALRSGVGPVVALSRLGLVDETAVAGALVEAHGLKRLGSSPEHEDQIELPSGINVRFLRRNAVSFASTGLDRWCVAMADPSDQNAIDALAFATGVDVIPMVATCSEIEALLEATDDGRAEAVTGSAADQSDLDRLAEGDSDAPIIRVVQSLLANAALRRASDVHIEPMARQLVVRYRIDGRLLEVAEHPNAMAAPIASRIKVMAGLDIAETRLPQDGRLRLTARGRDVDVRVSTSPTAYGESIVLRLLGRTDLPLDLEQLGLPAKALAALHRTLDRPHGIVLVTGPTGSGKTTTLYAALSRLRRPEVKILTVEDPVEVLLEGINQVQVRPEIGLSYAQTLRAFLRQDPDILMIGEIRDKDTAEIALRAALTGHLVLSTLHTNSTTGAFTRLADIGIEPYLAASTVNAVVAQRLIRTLCAECSTMRAPTSGEVMLFDGAGLLPPTAVSDPVGCSSCQATGYRGRMPLIEVLEVDSLLRDAIRDGSIERVANPTPAAETLLGHGLALVAAGRTTFAEVHRAVQSE